MPRLRGAPSAEGGLCGGAIEAAQDRHLVPPGLLFAIGQVESGRPDPVTRRLVPWPWTVQAQNQSYYFATKAEAVAWVQAAQARNILSIDVGCMQINLMYHPAAFQNLDEAFDPSANADYAARFLVSLHAETGDWQKASGLYHSQTLALAIPLRAEGRGGADRQAIARLDARAAQTHDADAAAASLGRDAGRSVRCPPAGDAAGADARGGMERPARVTAADPFPSLPCPTGAGSAEL